MRNNFLNMVIIFIFIITATFAQSNGYFDYKTNKENIDSIELSIDNEIVELENQRDSLITEAISEVDTYINKYAPRSKMTGEHIVISCIDADFDITLLMAQAHLETHFGQANSRNNVFGLAKKRYEHPDSAVVDYINLMQSRYIKNRTVDEALKSNLNVEGSSKYYYSELASYTNHVSSIRNKIIKTTNIETLFEEISIINRNINDYIL